MASTTKGKGKTDPLMQDLIVLAKIREQIGDPTGKLMQDELVQRIADIVHALGTAVVLYERSMAPGHKLIEEWKSLLPKDKA